MLLAWLKLTLALYACTVLAGPVHFHGLKRTGSLDSFNHFFLLNGLPANDSAVLTANFTQITDHFPNANISTNPLVATSATFNQTYFVYDFNYRSGGPVIFVIQGESPADNIWLRYGFTKIASERYGALVVSLEHRFYGDSIPTPDFTRQSLSLLTTRQAIADIVHFKQSFPSLYPQYNLTNSTKWIAIGGSYSGFLSAALRQKHPDEFYASHASSAPVNMTLDFWRFSYAVDQGIPRLPGGSIACINQWEETVRAFDDHLDALANDTAALTSFKAKFWMDGIDNLGDVASFVTTLLGSTVMYGPSGAIWNTTDSTSIPFLTAICDNTTYPALTSPEPSVRLDALADLVVTNLRYHQGFTGPHDPALLRNYSSTALGADTGARNDLLPWTHQFCTEFGYFQTTLPITQWRAPLGSTPFSRYVTVEYYRWACAAALQWPSVEPASEVTNAYYGGLNMDAGRILWVNGGLDPWRWLGVYEDGMRANKTGQVVVFVDEGTHCADLGAQAGDPVVAQLVEVWDGWLNGSSAGVVTPATNGGSNSDAVRGRSVVWGIMLCLTYFVL
ncbi:serine carboxypeptidase S28-domain-containing protein [Chytriomyces sp. MP71]|nr:serine carboxypeptidase S28-domain-containing protein [Chytriomyces sp. MP71]